MDYLEQLIEHLVNELLKYKEVSDLLKIRPMTKHYYITHRTQILWELLWINGRHDLIEKFARAELDNFGTIVEPINSFTGNNLIDTIIIDWCKSKKITVFNVEKTIQRLSEVIPVASTAMRA